MNLVEGTKIKGLIKNFQNYCVYIQLNIGYIGIVDKPSTVQNLKEKYKLGDIIDFIINKIDNKKKRMILNIEEKEKQIKTLQSKIEKLELDNNKQKIDLENNSDFKKKYENEKNKNDSLEREKV